MKSPIAYYLLLLYCAAICKPVLPIFQDFIAHTLFKHQHISTVHQQNGQNHVDAELSDAAKEGSTENTTKPKASDDITVHFPVECSVVLHNHQALAVHTYYDPHCTLPFTFTAIQIPPPKA